MFEFIINGKLFSSKDYETFCEDYDLWCRIQDESGYNGTGGDWRYISLSVHNEVTKKIEQGEFNVWHGIYKPYSIPPIGFKISK